MCFFKSRRDHLGDFCTTETVVPFIIAERNAKGTTIYGSGEANFGIIGFLLLPFFVGWRQKERRREKGTKLEAAAAAAVAAAVGRAIEASLRRFGYLEVLSRKLFLFGKKGEEEGGQGKLHGT